MKKTPPATSPDAYVSALTGWPQACVTTLRSTALANGSVEEVIKWGNVVYLSNGPAFMIRAEEHRVLFGFWRGRRLREIEPRLKAGGKYEMATMEFRAGTTIADATVRALVRAAVELNRDLGNPSYAAPAKKRPAKKPAEKPRLGKNKHPRG